MQILTIGELQDMIKRSGLPENTPVVYERIEDAYFENHNWHTVDVDWEIHPWGHRDEIENPDDFDFRYTTEEMAAAWNAPAHWFGPNGETMMLQSKAIEPWQAYKAWSRSLGCYVLVLTAHY